jgi:DNA-binding GntR family transcriptional regulator
VDEAMRHLLAELRLVFHVMAAPQAFHQTYLPHNRAILELLTEGDFAGAESAMAAYLDAAEAQLVEAYS